MKKAFKTLGTIVVAIFVIPYELICLFLSSFKEDFEPVNDFRDKMI